MTGDYGQTGERRGGGVEEEMEQGQQMESGVVVVVGGEGQMDQVDETRRLDEMEEWIK